jgi:AraC-like DNA-binding protein
MDIWVFSKFVALAYLLLFAFYLLLKGKANKSNYYLALFLVVEATSIVSTILWQFYDYTHIHFPYLFYIDNLIFYLRGVSLYFYIRSYTSDNFKVKYRDILHLTPFIVLSFVYYFSFHRFSSAEKIKIIETGLFHPYTSFLLDLSLHLLIVIYLVYAAKEINNYQKKLEDSFADFLKIWRNWTYFLIGGFFLIMFLDIIFMIIQFYYNIFPHTIVYIINILVFSLTVLIMLKGLSKPEIFASLTDKGPVKYIGSNLKEADRIIIRNKLDHLLNKEKIFQKPSISINDIANEIGVLPKYVSQVINEDYKQNFFDLINSFRIEEAKIMLTEYSSEMKNVLEILYETGFNSKTSFNLAFKKYTGLTPTSYRRQYSQAENSLKCSYKNKIFSPVS